MAPLPISSEQREHLRFLDARSTQILKFLFIFPSAPGTFLAFKDVATSFPNVKLGTLDSLEMGIDAKRTHPFLFRCLKASDRLLQSALKRSDPMDLGLNGEGGVPERWRRRWELPKPDGGRGNATQRRLDDLARMNKIEKSNPSSGDAILSQLHAF
jgi:hypothetical protein